MTIMNLVTPKAQTSVEHLSRTWAAQQSVTRIIVVGVMNYVTP
jgi:hypothetical protein